MRLTSRRRAWGAEDACGRGLPLPAVAGAATRRPDRRDGRQRHRKVECVPRVGFAGDEFGYALDLGLPSVSPTATAFSRDPEIMREAIWAGPVLRPATLLTDRAGGTVRTRGGDDGRSVITDSLAAFDSMLSEVADPQPDA